MVRWAGRLLACVPALVVGGQALLGKLGANPIEALLNHLGWWALVVLLASLACTPLRLLFKWRWIAPWRRIFGLAAFWYALAHVSVYVGLDKFFDLGDIISDVFKRPFITAGFAAFLMLLALAVTSPATMVRKLGGKRWRALHRLVYAAAALAVVHFLWRVKADQREPLLFALVLAVLLGVRLMWWARSRAKAQVHRAPVTPA